MKVLLSWLRDFAPVEGDPDRIGDQLSDLGLTVEQMSILGEGLDGIALAVVEVGETMAEPFDFGHPNPVGPSPKLGYQGCHRPGRRLVNVAVEFGVDDGLDCGDLSSPLPYASLGERSEVVHVKKSDTIELGG